MKKLILLTVAVLANFAIGFGQDNEIKSKSAFSRESLTKYYKATVDAGFFGQEDGKYTFGASLFGIKTIFNDSALNVDTVFLKKSNRNLRNVELDFSLSVGENNEIKSFTPSIKFALLNRRDTVSGTFEDFKRTNNVASTFNRAVVNVIATLNRTDQDSLNVNYGEYKKQLEDYNKGRQKDEPTFKIFGDKFGTLVRDEFFKLAKANPVFSDVDLNDFDSSKPNDIIRKQWEYDKDRISRRSLVTLHLSPEIDNGLNSFSADLVWLKGLNKNNVKSSESSFEMFAKFLTKNDTVDVENGVGERVTLSIGSNYNKVLLRDGSGDSNLEFKGGFDVASILKGEYQDEDKQTFNLNMVLSAKLTKDVYIPIEVKWDPVNANIFGFLNLTWNFTRGEGK